ncbi:hypothetical protein ACRPFF_11225, partial [Neisseria sp. SLRRB23]
HGILYLLMLAVPVICMIRQYSSGRGPLKVFGVEVMQGSPEKIEWMGHQLAERMDDIVCLTEFGKDFAFVVCRLDAVRNSFDIIRAFFAVVGLVKRLPFKSAVML